MSKPRVSLLVAMTGTLVLVGLSAVRLVHARQGDPALPVGSWSIQVQPEPGSPVPAGVNFAAFTRDGIVVNSNVSGLAGIGNWERVGPRSFAVTFTGFEVLEGQQLRFVIRSTIGLAPDSAEFDGPFLTAIYTADGASIASVSGTVHGARLTVQPLP